MQPQQSLHNGSAFLMEGPFREAPLPPGATQYPKYPEEARRRPPAGLMITATPPFPSTDSLRPAVPLWYYTVYGMDVSLTEALHRQGATEGEILPRAVLFSAFGPDLQQLAREATAKAVQLGWSPTPLNPRSPDPSGAYFRPWSEVNTRPRPPWVPLETVMQHSMTVRSKLFAGGNLPGWLFAWDDRGVPHKPCGISYGMQGLAIGAPCGRTSGCTLRGGGPCVWADGNLRDEALARGIVSVSADAAPVEPLPYIPPMPIAAHELGVPGGSLGLPPSGPAVPAGQPPRPQPPQGGPTFQWQPTPPTPHYAPPYVPPQPAYPSSFQSPVAGTPAWGGPGTPLPPQQVAGPPALTPPAPVPAPTPTLAWPAPPTNWPPPAPGPAPGPASSNGASPATVQEAPVPPAWGPPSPARPLDFS